MRAAPSIRQIYAAASGSTMSSTWEHVRQRLFLMPVHEILDKPGYTAVCILSLSPSSIRLGRRPLKPLRRVQIPLVTPNYIRHLQGLSVSAFYFNIILNRCICRQCMQDRGPVTCRLQENLHYTSTIMILQVKNYSRCALVE